MTTTTKHTPGPWQHWNYGIYTKPAFDTLTEMRQICSLSGCRDNDTSEANARLIALAPDMAEALRDALPLLVRLGDFIGNGEKTGEDSLGERCDLIGKARDLLARIDGEPDLDSPEECAARDAREEKRLADFDACHRARG